MGVGKGCKYAQMGYTPSLDVLKCGHFTRFVRLLNEPQATGTRPAEGSPASASVGLSMNFSSNYT